MHYEPQIISKTHSKTYLHRSHLNKATAMRYDLVNYATTMPLPFYRNCSRTSERSASRQQNVIKHHIGKKWNEINPPLVSYSRNTLANTAQQEKTSLCAKTKLTIPIALTSVWFSLTIIRVCELLLYVYLLVINITLQINSPVWSTGTELTTNSQRS